MRALNTEMAGARSPCTLRLAAAVLLGCTVAVAVSPAPTNSLDLLTPDTAEPVDAQSRWAPAAVKTRSRSMKLFGRRRRRVACAAHTLPKKLPNNSQWSGGCVDQTVSHPAGAVCTEECLPGFNARSTGTYTCDQDVGTGTWTGQKQNCVEKSCVTAPGEFGSPAPFASCTNLTGKSVRPGTVCHAACNKGYAAASAANASTYTCHEGRWTGGAIECNLDGTCSDSPPGGKAVWAKECWDKKCGSTCTAKCARGYNRSKTEPPAKHYDYTCQCHNNKDTKMTVGHWTPKADPEGGAAAAPKDCVGCTDSSGNLQPCACDGPPTKNTAACRGRIDKECNATCAAPFERLDVDGGWPFKCTAGGWRGGVARCGTRGPRRAPAAGGSDDDDGGDDAGGTAHGVPLWLVGLLVVAAVAIGFGTSTLCHKKQEVGVMSLTDALTNSDSFAG
eukprot:SAG22_NODE_843_length_6889_cov_61.521649_8_plen_446_part_00